MKKLFCAAVLAGLSAAASAQGTVNVICSVQAEWCNMIATVYARTTGTKVNMSLKGSGEALAQLIAEKDNPKTDIWFGGNRRSAPAGRRAGPHARIQVAHAAATARLGAAAGQAVGLQDRRHLFGAARFRLQHRVAGQEEAADPPDLGRSAQARVQGRHPGGEPPPPAARLHHDRHAGAADGRGQGLRLPEGAAQERRPVHAHRYRPDQGSGARRDRDLDQLRARRAGREDAGLPPSRPSRRAMAPAPRSAR